MYKLILKNVESTDGYGYLTNKTYQVDGAVETNKVEEINKGSGIYINKFEDTYEYVIDKEVTITYYEDSKDPYIETKEAWKIKFKIDDEGTLQPIKVYYFEKEKYEKDNDAYIEEIMNTDDQYYYYRFEDIYDSTQSYSVEYYGAKALRKIKEKVFSLSFELEPIQYNISQNSAPTL